MHQSVFKLYSKELGLLPNGENETNVSTVAIMLSVINQWLSKVCFFV